MRINTLGGFLWGVNTRAIGKRGMHCAGRKKEKMKKNGKVLSLRDRGEGDDLSNSPFEDVSWGFVVFSNTEYAPFSCTRGFWKRRVEPTWPSRFVSRKIQKD